MLGKEIWRRFEGCEMRTKRSVGETREKKVWTMEAWREDRRKLGSVVVRFVRCWEFLVRFVRCWGALVKFVR